MQEQDSRLATVIQELRFQQGRGVKPDFDGLGRFVEVLTPELTLSEIRRGVEVQCLERLGVTWDFRYGELAAYKEVHGDCNVPQTGSENPQLGTWVSNQRMFYAKGKSQLSEERVQRLNALGIVWNPLGGTCSPSEHFGQKPLKN